MASAVCTQCGKTYGWHGARGCTLKDNPSPCCNAPGKANRYSPVTPKVIKRCPDCGKAGLWWRKAIRNNTLPSQPLKDGHVDWATLYCPRCQKWVTPIREVLEVANV